MRIKVHPLFRSLVLMFILFTLGHDSSSQSKFPQVLHSYQPAGRYLSGNHPIQGEAYFFPGSIMDFDIDTTAGLMMAILKKPESEAVGKFMVYDLKSNEVKWFKELALMMNQVNLTNGIVMHTKAKKTTVIDVGSGKKVWNTNSPVFAAIDSPPVALNYSVSFLHPKVQGIDIANGRVLWERKIPSDYGWNGIWKIDDSTAIVAASGLHTINLYNGQGWSFITETGKDQVAEMIFQTMALNALGIGFGQLSGIYFYGYIVPPIIWDIVSNVVNDGSNFYFAGKNVITRLDMTSGDTLWISQLPEKMTSKSQLFLGNGLVYMINLGYAKKMNLHISIGTPYITAFDQETGEQRFFTTIGARKDSICDFRVNKEGIAVLFNNKLAMHDLDSGKFIGERYCHGSLIFNENEVYAFENDEYIDLVKQNAGNTYIKTGDGKILELNKDLKVTRILTTGDMYFRIDTANSYNLIHRKNEVIVLNHDGQPLVQLKASGNAKLIGSKVYDYNANRFMITDLSEIIQPDVRNGQVKR